jgi:hypothetical protein
MSLPTIWTIGDWGEPVFEEAVAWLRLHADCHCFDSSDETSICEAKGRKPHSIILVQSRPGRFCVEHIEKLHAIEPLARLIALTGPWCEGEQRTGRPIPGVSRVAWRNWRERLPVELGIDSNAIGQPRTMAETDRIEAMVKSTSRSPRCGGVTLICTARLADYNYIADAVLRLGLLPQLFDPPNVSASGAEVVIFDGWEQASLLQRHEPSQNGRSPPSCILLLDFPRPEDDALAASGGIDAVLPLPLSIGDLNAALARLLKCAA